MAAFQENGCRLVDWRDWPADATDDLLRREAANALSKARTHQAAAILLDQFNGALRCEVEAIQTELAAQRLQSARLRLSELSCSGRQGLRITQPPQVVVAGLPNVGKSSLFNALLGYQRAIVYNEPGTTRDVLSADTAIDGWPVTLLDAAGIRAVDDPVEASGVQLARSQLAQSDLVIWVLDACTLDAGGLASPLRVAQRQLADAAGDGAHDESLLVVVNKVDLLEQTPAAASDSIPTSAVTGAGVATLLAAIGARLTPQSFPPGHPTPFTQRQMELLTEAQAAALQGQSDLAASMLQQLIG